MNGRRLTDAQISTALRAHLPEAAAPGLTHPRMPPRAKRTKTTSARPSQNSQYTGFFAARKSWASMKTPVPMSAP